MAELPFANTGTTRVSRPPLLGAAVLGNAQRLLHDARILRSFRRYPSTAALAILCLEEVAKFVDMNRAVFGCGPLSDRRSHTAKHRLASETLIGNLLLGEVEAIVEQRGGKLAFRKKKAGAAREPITTQLARLMSEMTGDNVASALKPKLKRYQHVATLVDVASGKFNELKKRCFYIDEDRSENGSMAIDRKVADKLISLASSSIFIVHKRIGRLSHWGLRRR